MPATLENVTAILLGDGWHPVEKFAIMPVGGPVKWPNAFTCRERHLDTWFYGPASSILAVKASRYVADDEKASEAGAQREAAESQFAWQHRASSEVYAAAAQAQGGLCSKCGASLAESPITHYDELTKSVLCQACTPYQHRYGSN